MYRLRGFTQWHMPHAIEHCFSSFVMFPLLGQFPHLSTSHFSVHLALDWGNFLCLQQLLVGSFFPHFATLSSEFWEEVPVLFLKTLLRTTFSTFTLCSMNHGFSRSRCRGPILPYLSASGSIWLCFFVFQEPFSVTVFIFKLTKVLSSKEILTWS